MKKHDTLRRLIREAVLAEMGEMWRHGRVGEPSSDYHRTIEAWLQGEYISSRDFSRALETWFAIDKGMPDTRVSAIYFGGPIVLMGPGFEGGVLEMEIEDLEHAFYG